MDAGHGDILNLTNSEINREAMIDIDRQEDECAVVSWGQLSGCCVRKSAAYAVTSRKLQANNQAATGGISLEIVPCMELTTLVFCCRKARLRAPAYRTATNQWHT